MKNLDRAAVKKLRDDLQRVLDGANIEGLNLTLGAATFSPTEVTFKLSVKLEGHDDKIVADLVERYKFERTTSVDGRIKLVGFRPKARTRPFIIEKDGKRYVTDLYTVGLYFGRALPPASERLTKV